MSKILGLDLGTHSIGWALRDTSETENQIIDKGVLLFKKGVGEGKSGEFPLVQKRTESRGKRRNYQSEKYRKWSLLQTLIENGMCPLTLDELDQWRKYTKGTGRRYPQSEPFIQWLRFDFDGDTKPDFERLGFDKHESYYLFRVLAIKEEYKQIFQSNPYILGRVFYHLVQRRGFRGRDEEESKTIMQGGDKTGVKGASEIAPVIQQHGTLGAALYYLEKEKKERIRKRYNLRTDYETELLEICRVQEVKDDIKKRLLKSIVWQRPLRSQKGLVGVCTFETNKSRCPLSHPLYEEYRTWIAINNLKIRFDNPPECDEILEEKVYPLFLNASRDFKLSSISRELRKIDGKVTARTAKDPNTKLPSATLLHHFENLLGPDWKEKYGWHDLLQNKPKSCAYSIEDIWHILNTFDSREMLNSFARQKLLLPEDAAEKFSQIKLVTGYATLSLSAIRKLLPFLKKGLLYSHAVYLANMPKVLGRSHITQEEFLSLADVIKAMIKADTNERKLNTVVNGLISDQLNSDSGSRIGMTIDYQLDESDKNDIIDRLKETYGIETWEKIPEAEIKCHVGYVARHYLSFVQKPITYTKQNLFIKSIPLHEKIFSHIQQIYGLDSSRRKYLWHPSEQDIYPPVKMENEVPQLGDPQPISGGFKNPMALKTLHQLRRLINSLLRSGKIDEDTRVVVEIARELNDANRRKAIERWQKERERENDEYRKRIKEIADKENIPVDEKDGSIIKKYRLWIEQNKICLYTGSIINFTDLFKGNKYDFEHTIPASISFDNELTNLTIADSTFNRQIKGNKFPSQLPNYKEAALGYSAIQPRVAFMQGKVDALESQLEEWVVKAKFASTKEIKDACIQKRHLIRFELDYWRKKSTTFTITEFKAGWKNSQLKDTQIVTKYALPYIKTVFHKVSVEKGAVTSAFREIYQIQPRFEAKERIKHSHHATDAAVLTLIPPASIRDKILFNYNKAKDLTPTAVYHEPVKSWKNFKPYYILVLETDTLINYQSNIRSLTPTFKQVRKRGKQQFATIPNVEGKRAFKLDDKGQPIPLIARGDTIRGQLHKESFYGAINKNGERWMVERYAISSFSSITDCKHIVDDAVRKIVHEALQQRLDGGQSFDIAKSEPIFFPHNKTAIKKVRCRVAAGRGYLTPEKALEIRRHDFPSSHEYKRFLYAQNEENTACLFYEAGLSAQSDRLFRIISLYDLARLKIKTLEDLKHEPYYQTAEKSKSGAKTSISLSFIITPGIKVIPFRYEREELKELPRRELLNRLFRVYKFNQTTPSTIYVYLQNHLEARPNEDLGNGSAEIDWGKYQPRVFLNAARFICAIEGRDFQVSIDGEIRWLF